MQGLLHPTFRPLRGHRMSLAEGSMAARILQKPLSLSQIRRAPAMSVHASVLFASSSKQSSARRPDLGCRTCPLQQICLCAQEAQNTQTGAAFQGGSSQDTWVSHYCYCCSLAEGEDFQCPVCACTRVIRGALFTTTKG